MKSTIGLAVCLAALTWAVPVKAQETAPVLSLHDAIKASLQNSPAIGRAVAQNEAMKAAASKADALPNPELSIEAENIGGDGPYKNMDSAELTYGVSQLVELPGKRAGRAGVAGGEEQKSFYERDAARLDLIRDVVTAYAAVVSAEEELIILREEKDLAANVYESVAAKVDAGKEPPIQKNKASIELSSSILSLERVDRSLATARTVLKNLTGGPSVFSVSAATLPVMKQPDGIAAYAEKLQSTPDVLVYDAAIAAAQSNLSLEKASMVPDPTFNVGVRDFREDNEQAFVAGVSFPFPAFDMNRAGVRRAGHEYNAAMLDKAQAKLSAETDMARSYEAFANAYREHRILTDTVLPDAQEAFNAAREGYRAGKFGYLEVLDAQRTLFENRKKSNQAMFDYYRELAVIDRLIATHAIPQGEKK